MEYKDSSIDWSLCYNNEFFGDLVVVWVVWGVCRPNGNLCDNRSGWHTFHEDSINNRLQTLDGVGVTASKGGHSHETVGFGVGCQVTRLQGAILNSSDVITVHTNHATNSLCHLNDVKVS